MSTVPAITVADARNTLADILNRVAYGKERVVITRHGKQLAAIVPVEDLELTRKLRRFVAQKDVDHALSELDSGRARSWENLRRELGL